MKRSELKQIVKECLNEADIHGKVHPRNPDQAVYTNIQDALDNFDLAVEKMSNREAAEKLMELRKKMRPILLKLPGYR